EGDFLSENELLSEGDLSSKDDFLSEDNLLSEGNLSSEDDILNKADFNRETVDEPLSNEEMPSINREFAPYFSNITEVLMFFWIQKYNILDIIYHPQFKSEDVVKNIRRFRKYRQRLPLLKIKSHQIHISNKKTPSTSKDTKKAYCLSISDIIWYTLNNPSLFHTMYFGPGQEVTRNYELWHGNIWKESPRFGQES
ncbi:5844_t:CDS:2, partial [Gigaspora rosea]